MKKPVILWLRQDLRLHDNPALIAAAALNQPIIPLYILEQPSSIGAASRWWLHHSLIALKDAFSLQGLGLIVKQGEAKTVLQQLTATTNADRVVWNRRYDQPSMTIDADIKATLSSAGVICDSFNSHLLFEPWTIKTKKDQPYQIFTPFWKYCLTQKPPFPQTIPTTLKGFPLAGSSIDELGLLPAKPDWAGGLKEMWQPGEATALKRLDQFLDENITNYHEDRNHPNVDVTSRLSPHLAWGEISPRVIYYQTIRRLQEIPGMGAQTFLSEIGWREFSYHLLFHFPQLPTQPLKDKFKNFPWLSDTVLFDLWTKGLTGYPIVDAGMRQLWHTGWMHNRVRMIVASFLVKDLLLPWQQGAAWFWDTLVDADIASNSASWQWVSGCGADAAPYFRVFNPILQGEKFDKSGDYVRRWVPELNNLPSNVIHQPWIASTAYLKAANIHLGVTYPNPVIDHNKARLRALNVFKHLKEDNNIEE
jgi:deoxyribodipyrimidine photo-lyase